MYRCCFFFFNDTATTEIYTLSLHDALPISGDRRRRLKTKPGRELQVHGSGTLIRWLLDNDLVDEMNLFVFPAVVGQGTRLFPGTGPDTALELVESRATPNGVLIQAYRPAGRLQYGEEPLPT